MEELKDISEKNPFKVPDHYFEEITGKIISSTSGYGSDNKKISFYRRFRPYLAVAAAIALLAILSYSAFYFISAGNKPGIPEITVSEFSENYLNDIDLLTLEEKAGSIEPDLAEITLSGKDIVDYFIFENIDINDIYTQF